MRKISKETIVEEVKNLVIRANRELPADVLSALQKALDVEVSPLGKRVISEILENAQIAKDEKIPLCQDTGTALFFVEMGREAKIEEDIVSLIERGTVEGYREGFLRSSKCDPLTRKNSGDNTPATVHLNFVSGDKIKISFLAKGGGAENMSRLFMLSPSEGKDGVIRRVVETVDSAGAKACPPLIVGVGLGGTFDTVPIVAKRALLREVGVANQDEKIAAVEVEMLNEINKLGIGPMGYGGKVTALAVHIETRPCHIASLPATGWW
jgi:fumarate hydratase subunit alpha